MVGDAYLPADGEIEAEHAWVNEWTAPAAASIAAAHEVGAPAAITPAASAVVVAMPTIVAPAAAPAATFIAPSGGNIADPATDQLLRDVVEIAFARDMLEREPVTMPKRRGRIRMPVVVGGVLGLIMVMTASVVAGLIKVQR
jgi:hypothetical protein